MLRIWQDQLKVYNGVYNDKMQCDICKRGKVLNIWYNLKWVSLLSAHITKVYLNFFWLSCLNL